MAHVDHIVTVCCLIMICLVECMVKKCDFSKEDLKTCTGDEKYHCKETEKHAIEGCGVPEKCLKGQRMDLEDLGNGKVKPHCIECSNGTFMHKSLWSYDRFSTQCINHTTCDSSTNTVIYKQGTSEKDTQCRCNNREGYFKYGNKTDLVCNPSGKCSCNRKMCGAGQQLSEYGDCLSCPEGTENPNASYSPCTKITIQPSATTVPLVHSSPPTKPATTYISEKAVTPTSLPPQGNQTVIAILVIVGITCLCAVIIGLFIWWRWKRRSHKDNGSARNPEEGEAERELLPVGSSARRVELGSSNGPNLAAGSIAASTPDIASNRSLERNSPQPNQNGSSNGPNLAAGSIAASTPDIASNRSLERNSPQPNQNVTVNIPQSMNISSYKDCGQVHVTNIYQVPGGYPQTVGETADQSRGGGDDNNNAALNGEGHDDRSLSSSESGAGHNTHVPQPETPAAPSVNHPIQETRNEDEASGRIGQNTTNTPHQETGSPSKEPGWDVNLGIDPPKSARLLFPQRESDENCADAEDHEDETIPKTVS